MSTTLDRQMRPIYDAIDTGSNKSAIVACNKLLKKQPKNDLVKALKALALVRSQKVEESLYLCDEVLAAKPSDDATLSALSHVLRGLGRHMDIISMYDTAWKQQPGNEDLGTQTFAANVRTGHWKAAQQVATKLHKQFREDRYVYWSVFCAVLQANEPATPPALRPVLYKLAQRLISSVQTPSMISADRFYVHLTVLRELELYDEAIELLSSDIGQHMCRTNLTIDELRREFSRLKGAVKEEGQRAQHLVHERDDRNWLEFLSILDGTFYDVTSVSEPSDEAKEACKHSISKTSELLAQVADKDGARDRSGPLALLELEKRSRAHGLSSDPNALYTLATSYFERFSDKACAYEDLVPYIVFQGDDLTKWTQFLGKQTSIGNAGELRRTINALKLLRYNLTDGELAPEAELERVSLYIRLYLDGLPVGSGLPDTELQPADDLAVLAGQALAGLWKATGSLDHLYNAIALLEFALGKSKQNYIIRMLLIRIYHLLGAPALALEHYRLLNVKQVQNDTLSHFILSRASTFALSSTGDLTYSTECMEASQIYLSNSTETAEFVVRAFVSEKYSQIPEFVALEDRLDNSLQRDLMKMEHVRMRLAHESVTSDLVDMELIELKFIFDRHHYDNRDFKIIPNYQPRRQPSFLEATEAFGKVPGLGWLHLFLRLYIKAFQQASDLDDSVEDKLLIGDRPKPHPESTSNLGLNDRLAQRPQAELDELTDEERLLLEFSTGLSEWLGPHHDYVRPPPATVLAEAARQTELKIGHQPKGLTFTENGSSNGSSKKDEEPPVVQDPPDIVLTFFDDMKARLMSVLDKNATPLDLLHIATLSQEALLIFAVETARFKPPAIVKQHKLAPLVQSFKEIRAKAAAVLTEISAELAKLAEAEATPERRKLVSDACQQVSSFPEFDEEFVSGIVKKLTESRQHVLDGVSKGISKVSKSHT